MMTKMIISPFAKNGLLLYNLIREINEEMSNMELTIAMAISIIGVVLSVSNFALARKDKSNKDTEKNSYQQGKLDQTLKNIMEKLDKIEKKLDTYDNEIDTRIEKAIENHIKMYHKGGN